MTGKRERYSAGFEAKVALEAPRGELTAVQPATKHGIHRTMAGEWKKQAVKGLASVFPGKEAAQEGAQTAEVEVEKPHAEIDRPVERGRSPDVVERGFLAEAPGRWAWSGGGRWPSPSTPPRPSPGDASWCRSAAAGSTAGPRARRR